MLNFFVLFFSLTFFSACTKENKEKKIDLLEVTEVAKEQQIPKQIMQVLDLQLKEEFVGASPIFAFFPLKVGFIEQQDDVLSKPHVQFSFPKGGGALDFKDIVTGNGSFYMYFPQEQFNEDWELMNIFFVSNSPKTKIDGEDFGLGCGKWNDLKDNFKKLQKNNYLKLNTNDLRYLRVLAGTFVFVFKHQKSVHLSQLSFTDSRYSNELCLGDQ